MNCPECGADIPLPKDPLAGEIVSCPDCGTSYELAKGDDGKLRLEPAQVEGEDWGE